MQRSKALSRGSIILCLLTAIAGAAFADRIIYVDDDAVGTEDGASWQNAYKFLQDALGTASAGNQIRVARGIYKPDLGAGYARGDRGASFLFVGGITIKGGYAGLGTPDPNATDIELYKTVLSGDLNGDDADIADPCDFLNHPSRAENSWHVLWGESGSGAVIDGVTITGGNANYGTNEHRWGGGMVNFTDGSVVSNCVFTRNSASIGGALLMNSGSGLLVNSIFTENWACCGGAAWIQFPTTMEVNNCTFLRNSAVNGGGVYLLNAHSSASDLAGLPSRPAKADAEYAEPVLENCIIYANSDENGTGEFAQIDWAAKYSDFRNDIAYSCIQGWSGGGTGNINADPCFADPNQDYHLKSQAGRFQPVTQAWVTDNVTSPCIDAGSLISPIGIEPFPNGAIVNMGTYGGTARASKSYFGKPPCGFIIAADINGDCIVDWRDFVLMNEHWLEDNTPPPPPPHPPR